MSYLINILATREFNRIKKKSILHNSLSASDKPSQPGEVDTSAVTKDYITIQWEAPQCDGGKPVLGYWVEYRKSGESTWKKCNRELLKEREFTQGDLQEATEYEFRVFAENETGISRPRRTAAGIKTKLGGKYFCSSYLQYITLMIISFLTKKIYILEQLELYQPSEKRWMKLLPSLDRLPP